MNDREVTIARDLARTHLNVMQMKKATALADRARKDYGVKEQSIAYVHMLLCAKVDADAIIRAGVSSDVVRSAMHIQPRYLQEFHEFIASVVDSGDIPAMRVKALDLLWDSDEISNRSDSEKEKLLMAHLFLTRALAAAVRDR